MAWLFFSLLVLPDQYQVGVYPEQDLPHPTPGGWQYHVKASKDEKSYPLLPYRVDEGRCHPMVCPMPHALCPMLGGV